MVWLILPTPYVATSPLWASSMATLSDDQTFDPRRDEEVDDEADFAKQYDEWVASGRTPIMRFDPVCSRWWFNHPPCSIPIQDVPSKN